MASLHEVHKGSQENLRVLKTTYATIDATREWGAKYLNVPTMLVRKGRHEVEMEKVEIRMFIQVYEHLSNHVVVGN